MSSSDELFYLKDTRTGKFHSPSGLVQDKAKAQKFTELQLKVRLRVPKSYTKVFKEKMLNGGLVMEPVAENIGQFLFIENKLKVAYTDTDILDCDVEYHYKKDVKMGRTVYSFKNDFISRNKENKSGLLKVVLKVRKVVGKINK